MTGTAALVVAAGSSERFGGAVPKVLVPHAGRPLLAWTLEAFDRCDAVHDVVLVGSPPVRAAHARGELGGVKVRAVVAGGSSRQDSVRAGVAALPEGTRVVLVHDGARPFVTPGLVAAVAAAAAEAGAALPLLPVADTVKRVGPDGCVAATVPRDELRLAQTPQGFRLEVLAAAQAHAAEAGLQVTDDVALVEAALASGALPAGVRVAAVPGEEGNVKVTRPGDLPRARETRVGMGHDIHPLVAGRAFPLGGLDLMAGAAAGDRFGPAGHSDGDALVHATCDALLSAAGLGDIGMHFPDTHADNAGRPSLEFLAAVVALLRAGGWRVANVSAVVQLERPKVAPHADAIRAALASALGVPDGAVGLSAKRGEGLGPVGEGRAVVADVVALIERAP